MSEPSVSATDGELRLLNASDELIATLPVLRSTLGSPSVDIRRLLQTAGMTTFDPAYGSTASTKSSITFTDGERGVLLYRGYRIDQLVGRCSYLEVCYLLIYGTLPTTKQVEGFVAEVTLHTMVHEQVHRFYQGFRRDAHPMAIMLGVVGALSSFYPDSIDVKEPSQRNISIIRILAKMPTIAAMAYKYSVGQPFVYPSNDLDYSANFLQMLFSVPAEPYRQSPVFAAALNTLLIVQADHEQNASTSTVRSVASSLANPFACITAGIASLWGPAHGGANEAALRQLSEIGDEANIPKFIEKVRSKQVRLMGFGHRVYRNYDPRSIVLQQVYQDVVREAGLLNDPLFALATKLERFALHDEYFISRRLYPNVDFYSGLIMKALGIPTNVFTTIFAVSRVAGWLAHWKEAVEDPDLRITRPRQLYLGEQQRELSDIDSR